MDGSEGAPGAAIVSLNVNPADMKSMKGRATVHEGGNGSAR